MGFKEENYTPKGLCICVFLWMMIICNHSFAQTAPHCPIRVDLEPQLEMMSSAANNYRQNLFPFFNSWQGMNNLRLSDNSYATVSLDAHKRSTMIFGDNMSFNIPAGAQISGLEIQIEGHSRGQGFAEDFIVQLLDEDGERTGTNNTLTAIPTDRDWLVTPDSTDVIWTYGGVYDNWGIDLNEFIVNNPNFGYALQIRNKLEERVDVLVDNIQVIIHFTPLYSVCLDHACAPFYIDDSDDPLVTYEWYIPQGWELLSDSENDAAINIGPSYAELGTYEICVESFYAEDPMGICCRSFNFEDCNPGSISGLVFLDQNGDFQRDNSDILQPNVIVYLFETSGSLISTASTDNNGIYTFENVFQGEYYIQVGVEEDLTFVLPNIGSELTDSDIENTFGSGTTDILSISPGQEINNIDAGLSASLSIGDFIWEDINGDGIQQDNEPGIQGATATITNNLIGTIITESDENGFYLFENLPSSDYLLDFSAPQGFETTIQNAGNPDIDSDFDGNPILISYLNGGDIDSIDVGFFSFGSIGDYVWEDTNENGIQDTTEIGLPNFKLYLITSDGIIIDSTITDNDGAYLFSELIPDEYTVEVLINETYTITEENIGTDSGLDSDGILENGIISSSPIIISSGTNNLDIDFGFFVRPASIFGFSWLDSNNDGQFQSDEPFIEGIDVILFDEFGNQISETTSAVDGLWEFTNETPGNYFIQFSIPEGHFFTTPNVGDDLSDSDADGTNGFGTTGFFELLPGETTMDIAVGYQAFPSVTGLTWEDQNGNGTRESTDPPLPNIIVNLRRNDGSLIATDTSDENGLYHFDTLEVGDYYIEFMSGNLGFTEHIADTPLNSDVDGIIDTGATSIFSLIGNQNLTDIDAGLFSFGSLGDFVWEDLNMNGIQDIGEPGFVDAMAVLLDDQNNIISNFVPSDNGFYRFDNLAPGVYNLRVLTDPIYTATLANIGDDTLDSDGELVDGFIASGPIEILSGDTLLNYDFGFFLDPSEVGGLTWLDLNNDGQYQQEETHLSNIDVLLFDQNDVLTSQTTSDSTGAYNFTNIAPGEYYIQFNLPDGHIFTTANIGDDNFDSDVTGSIVAGSTDLFTLNPGETNMSVFAGYQVLPKVGNFVWLDRNQDGLQNPDETGINGITVTLFDSNNEVIATTLTSTNIETGTDGFYLFDSLDIGEYYIQFEQIDTLGYTQSLTSDETINSDITGENQEGSTAIFALTGNQCNLDIDAGYFLLNSNISGEVWVDSDEDGIQNANGVLLENITVRLFNTDDEQIEETLTDTLGQYAFLQVDEGEYYVVFDSTERYSPTIPLAGTDSALDSDLDNSQAIGSTRIFTLENGIDVENLDAGFIDGASTITGFTWIDDNNNGLLDALELSLDSIEVKLFNIDSTLVDSVLVDENGIYSFDMILPGEYFLIFENLDSTFFNVEANQGDDNLDDDLTNIIALGSTDTITTTLFMDITSVSAGYYQLASLGDMAFIDVNENGTNENDPGLNGVIVNLINIDGEIVNSATTAQGGGLDSGFYMIDNIVPGQYTLEFIRPLFYQFIDADFGMDDTIDSDVTSETANIGTTVEFSVTSGSTNTTLDAGFVFQIPMESSITGRAWEDENINGIQDNGELNRSGLVVELLNSNEEIVATSTTDNEGEYSFDQLLEGFYFVRILGLNQDETATIPNLGSDDMIDSDFFQAQGNSVSTEEFFLVNFESKEFVDLGIVPNITIGDFVWEDINNNGTQEGDELGIPNINVSIIDSSGVIQQNTTTDAEGKYLFEGLPAGAYQVCVMIPDGYFIGNKGTGVEQLDSDANENGCTDIITFFGGSDIDIDFAMIKESKIEGLAYTDFNGNGIRDIGDTGLNDIEIFLFSSLGEVLDSTTTNTIGDSDTIGFYSFNGLRPDDYYIQFDFPDEFIISNPNSGPDDIDSDITNAFGSGTTDIVSLNSGEEFLNLDGGAFLPGSIGDRVWEDLNKDGIQDDGEPGKEGIEVIIFRSFGVPFDTVMTNQLGEYTFTGLKQGLYFVQFVIPQEYTLSPSNIGNNDEVDSDADASGSTPLISLAHGVDLTSVDCGIYASTASLRSVVWEDINGDGLRQSTESRIPDIRITLFDEGDNAVASTLSNDLGLYAFQEIPEGNYKIHVDLIGTDYSFTSIDMSSDDLFDSDIYENGESDIFSSAEVLSVPNIDVGLFEMGNIGAEAWNDENKNGIFDLDESSISGIHVKLYDHQDQMVTQLQTSSSDSENIYFSNLRPGKYYMTYKFDSNLGASIIDDGEVAFDNNSDTRLLNGAYQSPLFDVTSSNIVTNIDAGFYIKQGVTKDLMVDVEEKDVEESSEKTNETEAVEINEKEIQFSIHPNPATNYISINLEENKNASLSILNGEKKVVLSVNNDQINQVNISDLHPGIYYIVVKQGEKSMTKKFIKVH